MKSSWNVGQVLEAVREEFAKILEGKTGWGREEVKTALERAMSAALLRFL